MRVSMIKAYESGHSAEKAHAHDDHDREHGAHGH